MRALRKTARPDSDLDIGVLPAPGKRIPDKLALMHEVSAGIGRDIDIVDLRSAGLDLIREVLQHGQLLFVTRPADTLVWEAECMTDYAAFNPRRADILDLYLKQPLRART